MDYPTLLERFKPYEAQLKATAGCKEILTSESLPYASDAKYQNTVMNIFIMWHSDVYHDNTDFFSIQIYVDGSWRRNDTPPEILNVLTLFLDQAKCIDAPVAESANNGAQTTSSPEGLKPQEVNDAW
jgi:hypothetical protein